jgi:hypothetical protein
VPYKIKSVHLLVIEVIITKMHGATHIKVPVIFEPPCNSQSRLELILPDARINVILFGPLGAQTLLKSAFNNACFIPLGHTQRNPAPSDDPNEGLTI